MPLRFPLLLQFACWWQLAPAQDLPDTSAIRYTAKDTVYIIPLGSTPVSVKLSRYGDAPEPFFINLHDDEGTSVAAAREWLEREGGSLLKIENGGRRNLRFRVKGKYYTIDPNRMFSPEGITMNLRRLHHYHQSAVPAVEAFAARFLSLVPDSLYCLVALHNNTEGGLSINSYRPGGVYEKDARKAYTDSVRETDDFLLTTDSLIYAGMQERGFNSVWQDNKGAARDGSLSIFYGERGLRYVNIETRHGRKEEYLLMLQNLMEVLQKIRAGAEYEQ